MTAIDARPRPAAGARLRRLRIAALAAAIPLAGLLGSAIGAGRQAKDAADTVDWPRILNVVQDLLGTPGEAGR